MIGNESDQIKLFSRPEPSTTRPPSDFDLDEDVGASVAGNFDFADLRARRGFRLDHCEHGAGMEAPL